MWRVSDESWSTLADGVGTCDGRGTHRGAAAPAVATTDLPAPQPDAPYLIPTEATFDDSSTLPSECSESSTVPVDVAQALLQIEVEHPELGPAGSVWDPQSGKVALYATADAHRVETILAELGVSDSIEVRHATRSAAQKAQIVRDLLGSDGALESGHQIVSVAPSTDGSTFTVILDENIRTRSAVQLPDVDADIVIEYGPPAEPVTRNHAPTPQRFSGAYMSQGRFSCSSGFRVTEITTSTPAMASAHHCGQSTFEQWYYGTGTSHLFGQFQGGLYPGGAYYGDITSWKGAGLADFAPGIFIGDNTVAGSGVFAIRGAVSSTVGTNVCYSGSRSGTVCGNTITGTGQGVCYLDVPVCYENIVVTQQISGVPAAGNGDSGGPVYQPVSPQGPYAAGVISGIRNGTATCTGDPGSTDPKGRKCSSTVLYAPITEIFSHGFGLNYVPYTP